jgi:hypothetical protein
VTLGILQTKMTCKHLWLKDLRQKRAGTGLEPVNHSLVGVALPLAYPAQSSSSAISSERTLLDSLLLAFPAIL